MKKVSLSGSVRKNVGKKDAKLMRREGLVPSVVYGNKEQVHFSVKENDINKIVFTPNVYMIDLDVDGRKAQAILKDVQIHPVTDKVLHADFQEVIEGKKVKVDIPVNISGLAVGVKNGGKLVQNFRRLTAEALADNLPDTIDIDVTKVKIGGKVRVGEVDIEGVSFLNPESAVVVAVQMARGAKKPGEEEEEEAEA
ncbi:MAG: 50S ribosomal protein L25/general stress protein Ctc [Flavobacteriales bacterium]|jgi:large subunit ribosomal protein L25|nr:50S ribosomal protein L25/general stress protein Ctc [Flavobacteriales bacterium]